MISRGKARQHPTSPPKPGAGRVAPRVRPRRLRQLRAPKPRPDPSPSLTTFGNPARTPDRRAEGYGGPGLRHGGDPGGRARVRWPDIWVCGGYVRSGRVDHRSSGLCAAKMGTSPAVAIPHQPRPRDDRTRGSETLRLGLPIFPPLIPPPPLGDGPAPAERGALVVRREPDPRMARPPVGQTSGPGNGEPGTATTG